jgi:hypothetical protein
MKGLVVSILSLLLKMIIVYFISSVCTLGNTLLRVGKVYCEAALNIETT